MNEDNTIKKDEELAVTNQKPLFTEEQRESFVRAFVEAWNTGQVWLEFPKSTREKSTDPVIDLLLLSSMENVSPSKENLNARNILTKKINNDIKIVSGSIYAPPEVIHLTIENLYNVIVDLRGHKLLGGSFLTNEMENRIHAKIIERVDKHINKIREELGLNNV